MNKQKRAERDQQIIDTMKDIKSGDGRVIMIQKLASKHSLSIQMIYVILSKGATS